MVPGKLPSARELNKVPAGVSEKRMKTFELDYFVGEHKVSGAFFDDVGGVRALRFTLDGKNYEAVENADDGYRSSLEEIRETKISPEFKFKAVKVVGTQETGKNEILRFLNLKTGKVILEIGTSDTDDYYPGFVGEFHPHNL